MFVIRNKSLKFSHWPSKIKILNLFSRIWAQQVGPLSAQKLDPPVCPQKSSRNTRAVGPGVQPVRKNSRYFTKWEFSWRLVTGLQQLHPILLFFETLAVVLLVPWCPVVGGSCQYVTYWNPISLADFKGKTHPTPLHDYPLLPPKKVLPWKFSAESPKPFLNPRTRSYGCYGLYLR